MATGCVAFRAANRSSFSLNKHVFIRDAVRTISVMKSYDGKSNSARSLAVVTGASSGIGFYLAKECAENGYDLLIAADSTELEQAAEKLRSFGRHVQTVETDLATIEGVDELYEATIGRPVDILMANAGHGLGHAFLDQDFEEARHVIDTNVTGTVYLIHKIGRNMRARRSGRILFTGSIAGLCRAHTMRFITRRRLLSTHFRLLCAPN